MLIDASLRLHLSLGIMGPWVFWLGFFENLGILGICVFWARGLWDEVFWGGTRVRFSVTASVDILAKLAGGDLRRWRLPLGYVGCGEGSDTNRLRLPLRYELYPGKIASLKYSQ